MSPVFRGGPFTVAHNRETRTVDDEMNTFVGRNATKCEVDVLAAAGQRGVIRGGAIEPHHREERVQEALGSAERQVEEQTKRQCRFDRRIRILQLRSSLAQSHTHLEHFQK